LEDKIVTLTQFTEYQDFIIVKSKLESEGIEVFSGDDYTVTILPVLSNVIGGTKLNVRASQAKKALGIIKTININRAASDSENEIMVHNRMFTKTYDECPKCDSENVFYEKHSFFKSLFTNFTKREHYCKDCKHHWFQHI
jgi:hypothetical protein